MPEVPHDATVALRLELGRERDRANAFESALRKEVLAVIADAASENARLKAEVERLTKAGDAMASSIQFNEEMAQDYNGPTIVHKSVQRWNAAKEGKPHA